MGQSTLNVDTSAHIEAVRREGQRIGTIARRADLDALVPTCPGWTIRDLVRHVGGIHYWARTIVAEARPRPFDPFPILEDNWPADAELADWFAAGHISLVETLEAAPEDLTCFAFLPASSPRAFWARRQAHETGVHRVDIESAAGEVSPFAPDIAHDGLDELLLGFVRRGMPLRTETPRALAIETTDTGGSWAVRTSQDNPAVTVEHVESPDCRVAGAASDIYLFLWNRRAADGLDIQGDQSLLDAWRTAVQVRWR